MFVELHMIQNFAPANLNRDDTNAPKDCDFGGHRRARISSQCIKRAIRRQFQLDGLIDGENLSDRTKRLVKQLCDRLEESGRDQDEPRTVAAAALDAAGLSVDQDDKTKYLLFLGRQEVDSLAKVVNEKWEVLLELAAQKEQKPDKAKAKELDKSKAELKKTVRQLLDGGKAADLALFGRMIADLPDRNVDAACQVAHAISTHKAEMEFDFYTAVDDLQEKEETGSAMMGTIEFNSSCFYRYANIDFGQLVDNLQGDGQLARDSVEAFIRAAVAAVPTGKQNSMAAQNPPSFVLAVVRPHGLWSLANAFIKPVWPDAQKDLIQKSIERLDEYWGRLTSAYCGTGNGAAAPKVMFFKVHDADLAHLKDKKKGLDELVNGVIATLPAAEEAKA